MSGALRFIIFLLYNLILTLINVLISSIYSSKRKKIVIFFLENKKICELIVQNKTISRLSWFNVIKEYEESNLTAIRRNDIQSGIKFNIMFSFFVNLIVSVLFRNFSLTRFETVVTNTIDNIFRQILMTSFMYNYMFFGHIFSIQQKCFLTDISYEDIAKDITKNKIEFS